MEFLAELDSLDLNLASEFIEVGATLIEIKTKQILPKIKDEEEEEEDSEAKLRAQLEEYKLLKEASEKLKMQEDTGRFYKAPEPVKEVIKYNLDNLDMSSLTDAFLRILHRVEKSSAPVAAKAIKRDRFTVAEKIVDIRKRLIASKNIAFMALFDEETTKSEIINTFLAMLELLKGGEIRVEQPNQFAEIQIVAGENLKTCDKLINEVGGEIEYEVIDGIED